MRERETKVSNPLTGGGSNRGQSPPSPTPSQKGGKCVGQRSRRTRVATPGARTAFSPSPTPAHNNSPFSP
jgi:hypothetical protein